MGEYELQADRETVYPCGRSPYILVVSESSLEPPQNLFSLVRGVIALSHQHAQQRLVHVLGHVFASPQMNTAPSFLPTVPFTMG